MAAAAVIIASILSCCDFHGAVLAIFFDTLDQAGNVLVLTNILCVLLKILYSAKTLTFGIELLRFCLDVKEKIVHIGHGQDMMKELRALCSYCAHSIAIQMIMSDGHDVLSKVHEHLGTLLDHELVTEFSRQSRLKAHLESNSMPYEILPNAEQAFVYSLALESLRYIMQYQSPH